MSTIVTRAGKGSPLTQAEVDQNFINLNADKLDTSGLALGSAASPSLKFTGDANTGIYSPGADQVAFSTSGTERLKVDSGGRLLVGTSTARSNFFNAGNTALFQVEGTGETAAIRNLNDDFGSMLLLGKSRSTSNTIVQNNDNIGLLSFQGNDGTEFVECAAIKAVVDGTPGANDMPGRLVFSTTADGASSPTERLTIDSAGIVNITNTPTYADNAAATAGGLVAGDIYRKSDGTLMIRY